MERSNKMKTEQDYVNEILDLILQLKNKIKEARKNYIKVSFTFNNDYYVSHKLINFLIFDDILNINQVIKIDKNLFPEDNK